MAQMKECFGQLANISIKYRDNSKQHFFRMDEEKLKECDSCNLFTKCMFIKYNEMFKEMLQMIDAQAGGQSTRNKL